ncbi:hypothetical protein [Actinobacillus suis]|uniref:hypothetical protein n=1 Tax=Actinobacillus suis TaxID=716 RepID=UPI000E30B4FC|nr:hypothetical protein [Actinobacillus suis]
MSNVYLAMYKADGDWVDKVIRVFTGKPYSHCEIAVANAGKYLCYSSSPRDGGVRCKAMRLPADKWDLIPIDHLTSGELAQQFYAQTKGKKYDLLGAIGVVLFRLQSPKRYFCSEWCYELIFGRAKTISPNKLFKLVVSKDKND